MMDFITANPLLVVVVVAVFVLITAFLVYRAYKKRGLDGIREEVYKLFLLAEKMFLEPGSGEEKFDYVIKFARGLLPKALQVLITDKQLRAIIQFWFDETKDLLDDGRFNKSNKGE